MRTIAALLTAFPLLAAAQSAQPPQGWVDEPAPSATPAPAQAPAPAVPPPAAQPPPPAYPPPPQATPPAQPPPPAYPPPPQATPPAQPPAYAPPPGAPPANVRPKKTRDRWYIGFGVGGGNGKVATATDTFTFREANGDRSTDTTFFNLKLGATLTPKLLLGADISGTVSSADSGGVKSELVISNFDAVLTYFPSEKGFFLRGGMGPSAISFSWEDPTSGKHDASRDGFNVLGGIGYAFWLGKQFNLTVNLDFSRQWYGGTSDLLIEDAQYWSLWAGFDWY